MAEGSRRSAWKLVSAIAGGFAMVAGFFGYLENVTRTMENLEREVVEVSRIEETRDEGWMRQDRDIAAEQNRLLQQIVAQNELIIVGMGEQGVSLARIQSEQATQFLQRENRFEELESENKLILEAINAERAEHSYQIADWSGQVQVVIGQLKGGGEGRRP